MKECPFCAKDLTDDAATLCPHCGLNLASPAIAPREPVVVDSAITLGTEPLREPDSDDE
jgi:hypothetical protein